MGDFLDRNPRGKQRKHKNNLHLTIRHGAPRRNQLLRKSLNCSIPLYDQTPEDEGHCDKRLQTSTKFKNSALLFAAKSHRKMRNTHHLWLQLPVLQVADHLTTTDGAVSRHMIYARLSGFSEGACVSSAISNAL